MDGIIIINKPKGCTSHDIVNKVKKLTNNKVGHTGTLDPNATGVLPLLIGKGTLLSKYLINHDKTYEVVLKLGEKTDTADSEGKVIDIKEVDLKSIEESSLAKVLQGFLGKQNQIPPMYSAIKINGKKLYEYARKEEKVEITPREIEIYSIELQNINRENKEISFIVSCSKGTYIRSLCEDIAEKLNTVGYMKELNRTQVGDFLIQDSITVEEFEKNLNNQDFISEHLISVEKLFKNNSDIMLDKNALHKFINGTRIENQSEDGVYKIYNETGSFIGTGTIQNMSLKRDIVIDDKIYN